MSLKVYRAILDKIPRVDDFYGNEKKVRQTLLGLSVTELSKEVGFSRSYTGWTLSLLEEKPSYKIRLLLRRLYDAKPPVSYKKIKKDIGEIVQLILLEKMGIVEFEVLKREQRITKINKTRIERYWPKITLGRIKWIGGFF